MENFLKNPNNRDKADKIAKEERLAYKEEQKKTKEYE